MPTCSIMSKAISAFHLPMMWIVVPRLIARKLGMIPPRWNIGPRITAGVAIARW